MRKNLFITVVTAAFVSVVLTGCGELPFTSPGVTSAPSETPQAVVQPSVVPEASQTPTDVSEPVEDDNETVALLNSLEIAEPGSGTYNREKDFGSAWADVDNNGCDTRNDVLAVQLTNITKKDTCTVLTGDLVDPYTNETVSFVRGQKTSILVPIDHIYSLKAAWLHGAQSWTVEKRTEFANDPENLVATTQAFNSWKSAKNPFDMESSPQKPANFEGTCFYATKFITIAAKYNLSVTSNDFGTLQSYLQSC